MSRPLWHLGGKPSKPPPVQPLLGPPGDKGPTALPRPTSPVPEAVGIPVTREGLRAAVGG